MINFYGQDKVSPCYRNDNSRVVEAILIFYVAIELVGLIYKHVEVFSRILIGNRSFLLPQYDKEILLTLFSTMGRIIPLYSLSRRFPIRSFCGSIRYSSFRGVGSSRLRLRLRLRYRVLNSRMTSFPRKTMYLVISEKKLVCVRSRSSDWIGKGLENQSSRWQATDNLFSEILRSKNCEWFKFAVPYQR